jgi:hypothetical protein
MTEDMCMNPTSDEIDRIDHQRRRALVLLGLTAAAAYSAPILLNLLPAKAQGDGGDDDGHGSGDDDDDDEGHDGDFKGPTVPPEAP